MLFAQIVFVLITTIHLKSSIVYSKSNYKDIILSRDFMDYLIIVCEQIIGLSERIISCMSAFHLINGFGDFNEC